jgi:hypothetical protein
MEDTLDRRTSVFKQHFVSQTSSSSISPAPTSSPASASNGTGEGSEPPYTAANKGKLKWNGWGYEDTEFDLSEEGHIYLAGDRYQAAPTYFPNFRPWLEVTIDGLDIEDTAQMRDTIVCPPGGKKGRENGQDDTLW